MVRVLCHVNFARVYFTRKNDRTRPHPDIRSSSAASPASNKLKRSPLRRSTRCRPTRSTTHPSVRHQLKNPRRRRTGRHAGPPGRALHRFHPHPRAQKRKRNRPNAKPQIPCLVLAPIQSLLRRTTQRQERSEAEGKITLPSSKISPSATAPNPRLLGL